MRNSFVKSLMGLYMYATGAQRQLIAVVSSLGIVDSYSNLTRQGTAPLPDLATKISSPASLENTAQSPETLSAEEPVEKLLPKQRTITNGTLARLSYNMRQQARSVASTGVFGTVYDNINWMARNAEQTLGRKGMF